MHLLKSLTTSPDGPLHIHHYSSDKKIISWEGVDNSPRVIILSSEMDLIATTIRIRESALREDSSKTRKSLLPFEAHPHVFCVPRGSLANLELIADDNQIYNLKIRAIKS